LLVLAWLAPLVLPHAGDDDLLCVSVPSQDAGLGMRATVGAEQQQHHCVICHSARSYRSALSDCGAVAVSLSAEQPVASFTIGRPRTPAFDRRLSRAPPA
jgi:hypothetical protein